ncbi:N-6 DNA methylase [Helicobacter saguini]|uniref:restriction endonuclease subunit S n=1 Tax=Helicobacter saguini TaxID=1548018 RepID=UPI000E57A3F8|nr:restriction endonuclease subunit S [Helicobacter saguini]MWV62510.1 N-6 DNA methylase [Helicobacter saguini]
MGGGVKPFNQTTKDFKNTESKLKDSNTAIESNKNIESNLKNSKQNIESKNTDFKNLNISKSKNIESTKDSKRNIESNIEVSKQNIEFNPKDSKRNIESNLKDSKNIESNIYTKHFKQHNCELKVDFKNTKLIYPKEIIIHDETTSNFSKAENFVVFECVNRLLEKGYKPEHLELEPKWKLGGENKGGKADILVRDNENNPYLIIECKTTDSKKSEFEKEWDNMLNSGGQLFSYLQQERVTKFLCLYTSDFIESTQDSINQNTQQDSINHTQNKLIYENYIINVQDNDSYLIENDLELSYKKANNNIELFNAWKESYKLDKHTKGIFESNITAYKILESNLTFNDLKELNIKEESKYHEFAKILRKHNISGKENAFDKLVNLFLCKIYDEIYNTQNLQFSYLGVMADTFADMQDRLMLLYKNAMGKFLGEEITFVSNDDIDKDFTNLTNNKDSIKHLKLTMQNYIKQLKFYSNNDFAFLEVHNKELFLKNALVLKEVLESFAPFKLTQNSTNQFLGNLFELFLQKGMKQDEGQFFTPIQICEFIIYSLPLENILDSKIPKVLDFACGAGHFLNTYANTIKNFINKKDSKKHHKQIYGIEKEYRLSKVAKVSSAMYGQSEINILYADALSSFELANPKVSDEEKQKIQIKPHSFDILIANPPYSVKGFLETLSAKSKKTYTLFNTDINIESNNTIECFFIERAKQLLRDNALAAIILPSSLLNKGGIYEKAREIILQNFFIIAIVELGSVTFGATGTNTIILFLQKHESLNFNEKEYISKTYAELQNRLDSQNLKANDDFKTKDYLKAYCEFRGFNLESYLDFLDSNISTLSGGKRDLNRIEILKDYNDSFIKSNEYKKLIESKSYKDSDSKQDLKLNALLNYALKIEKQKLLYFALAYKRKILVIKSPSDLKEQKRFLGYEWSNKKGNEGLKELNTPYLTPLFERENINNTNKLNFLIKQAFNISLQNTAFNNEIPQDLESYAFYTNLIDCIDFSKVEFDKAINLNISSKSGSIESNPFANCKYPLIKLESICKMYQPKTITSAEILDNGKYKVYGANGVIGYYNEYNHKDSEVAMTCRGATCGTINFTEPESWITGNAMIITPLDSKKILKKFLVYILPLTNIKYVITGTAQPQITRTNLSQLQIPLPPLEIQKQIVKECQEVEKLDSMLSNLIESYKLLIQQILYFCQIIESKPTHSLDSTLQNIQNIESNLLKDSNINKDSKNIQSTLPTQKTDSKNIESNNTPTLESTLNKQDLKTLKALLDSIKPTFETIQNNQQTYKLNNTELFTLQIGKRVLDSELLPNGKIPVFSANVLKPFGFINKEILKNYDKDSVLWGIDGDWLVGFIPKNTPFYPTDHCGVLQVNEAKNNAKYLKFILEYSGVKAGFSRTLRASIERVGNLKINLPSKESQEKIAQTIDFIESKITQLDSIKQTLENKTQEILNTHLNSN